MTNYIISANIKLEYFNGQRGAKMKEGKTTHEFNPATKEKVYKRRPLEFRANSYRPNGGDRDFEYIAEGDKIFVHFTCPKAPQKTYGNWELLVLDVVRGTNQNDPAYITCSLVHNTSPHVLEKVQWVSLFVNPDKTGWIHSICHLNRRTNKKKRRPSPGARWKAEVAKILEENPHAVAIEEDGEICVMCLKKGTHHADGTLFSKEELRTQALKLLTATKINWN